MNLVLLLRTLISYLLLGILLAICIPPLVLLALLPERYRYTNKLYFLLTYIIYKGILVLSFLPVSIQGSENIPDHPSIFVANHQSSLDIPVVGSIIGTAPHVWLVLEYYANTLVLGFFVRRMSVPVNRADKVKAGRALVKLLKLVKTYKTHVVIFPEGGRFNDDKVHDFFPGFAILAQKTERPVVPIYMPNNYKIYPIGSFYVYSYPIKATMGKPLYCQPDESAQEFSDRVREWFVEQSGQKE